jgi:hypothetical protein
MANPHLHAPLQSVAMSPENIAIAEIPPAMRKRLRAVGQLVGFVLDVLILIGVIGGEATLKQLLPSHFGFDVPATRLVIHSLDLVALLVVVALPLIFARLSLLSEVRYRRRHGKWRWEW